MKAILLPAVTEAPDGEGAIAGAGPLTSWLSDHGVEDVTVFPDVEGAPAWPFDAVEAPSGPAAASQLKSLRDWLGEQSCVVIREDLPVFFDLDGLLGEHASSPAIATVAVIQASAVTGGNVEMDRAGRVLRLTGERTGGGMPWWNIQAYVIEPRLLDSVPDDEEWTLEGDLFGLVIRAQGILGGYVARGVRPARSDIAESASL